MSKSILVLGTTSSAGKSFTAAALVRYFRRKGLKTAPFKAWNLSSKFHELPGGKKMSYSTYLQTLAAGTEPDEHMNPVYVCPSGNEMKLYMNGELRFEGSYRQYASFFDECARVSVEDYEWLSERYDVIVMEGSGSPAEVNCLDRDLANRVMAESVNPCTLLVGDIFQGGVFAALHGTLDLMPEKERETVRGFIINRYSGDPADLAPGLRVIEERHSVPCVGILPFTPELRINPDDVVGREKVFDRMADLIEEHCDFGRMGF